MKRQMFQKLLTSTATLLACTLLIGNIPTPAPTDEEESSIVFELPSSEDNAENEALTPLDDDIPWGDSTE